MALSSSSSLASAVRLIALPSSPLLIAVALLLLPVSVFLALHCITNYFTCRVKHVPGPWHTKFTHYVLKYHIARAHRMHYVHALHQAYGPIVRISPDEVSIADLQAVLTVHKMGAGFPKSKWYESFVAPIETNPTTVRPLFVTRDSKVHAAKRKLFTRPFSHASLVANWDQVIRQKVSMAVARIRDEAAAGRPGGADILKWWTLMASDLIAHLMFGESFQSLELGKPSPLIGALQRAGIVSILTTEFPPLAWIAKRVPIPAVQHFFHANEVIDEYGGLAYRNLRSGDVNLRNLFGLALASADNSEELNQPEQKSFVELMVRNESTNFLFAGTDTTAATLTYLIWAILQQPALRAALEEEVATLSNALGHDELQHQAPLLNSAIDEALRLYGAAPSGLPREVPAGGAELCGYFFPEGVTVSHQAYTLHRDPNIFPNPLEFDGWRFVKQPLTPAQKAAFKPFGLGSRNCLGIHLAMMELRLATAVFIRQCRGARLCPETTDDSMEMLDTFTIAPKAHRCNIMIEKKPLMEDNV